MVNQFVAIHLNHISPYSLGLKNLYECEVRKGVQEKCGEKKGKQINVLMLKGSVI